MAVIYYLSIVAIMQSRNRCDSLMQKQKQWDMYTIVWLNTEAATILNLLANREPPPSCYPAGQFQCRMELGTGSTNLKTGMRAMPPLHPQACPGTQIGSQSRSMFPSSMQEMGGATSCMRHGGIYLSMQCCAWDTHPSCLFGYRDTF